MATVFFNLLLLWRWSLIKCFLRNLSLSRIILWIVSSWNQWEIKTVIDYIWYQREEVKFSIKSLLNALLHFHFAAKQEMQCFSFVNILTPFAFHTSNMFITCVKRLCFLLHWKKFGMKGKPSKHSRYGKHWMPEKHSPAQQPVTKAHW